MTGKIKPLALVCWALSAIGPAAAADWSGEIALLTDYRDRGVSRTDRDPAVQATVHADLTPAWRLSAWASSLNDDPLGDAEINLTASYAGGFGLQGFWSAGIQGVLHPGGTLGGNHVEFYGNAGLDYGLLVPYLGVTFAPSNDDGTGGNVYGQARVDAYWPGKPFGAMLSAGFEHFERGRDKWDWSLGVFHTAGPATFTLRYVDTDQPGRLGGSAAVLDVRFGF